MAASVIIGAKHMPTGGLQGGFGSVTATGLREIAIHSAPARAGAPGNAVNDPLLDVDHDRRNVNGDEPLAVTIKKGVIQCPQP
ncbi:hypothetical protein AB9K34_16950 [Sedimentitalea sp. XS_ASV28]|uniref:hypothetical protein n=1 Tax=Sedimentitalea sp. XS_ASV28 TaxID=3241296 RepID=UPI00351172DD